MKLKIPSIKELRGHLRDPLYRNSIFLMLSSLTLSTSGFFFWVIAARFYPAEDVGLASAIISAMGLIALLSSLGFDISFVRFLHEREDKSELINSCFTITFVVSLIMSLIFVAGIDIWSPSLGIIRENFVIILLFVFFTTIVSLRRLQAEGIFAGFRKAEYALVISIVAFSRVVIIPFLTSYGFMGIYIPYGITPIFSFALGVHFISRILPTYKPAFMIKKDVIKDIFHFSSGNYLARILEVIPFFVLPLMVINLLGPEMNAYFYIAWQISNLLLIISKASSKSLLAEGSYDMHSFYTKIKKTLIFIFLILGVLIILFLLFGKYLLLFFGSGYAEKSLELLLLLSIASVPFAINSVYATINRFKMQIKPVIYIYGGITTITLFLTYTLIQSIGILGVGIAWNLGNVIVACGIGVAMLKKTDI